MKIKSLMRTTAAVALLQVIALPAFAGTYSGVITDDGGNVMEGVLVRVNHEERGVAESVFSDANGNFRLETGLSGTLDVRLRTPYYRDVTTIIELGADATISQNLVMEAMTDDQEISDSLPAGYHFGSLPFETGEDAVFNAFQFQRDCLSCHQIGNAMTRVPRDPDSWHETIIRMHRYMGGTFDEELRERRSVILSEGFDGKPLDVRPEFPLDPSLATTKIFEYRLDEGNPHDAIVHPETDIIYSVDQGWSHVAITDTTTGQTTYVQQQGKGNEFHVPGSTTGEIGNFKDGTRNAPHSLALRADGLYYVTNTATNTIGVFNPQTAEWEPSYVIGSGANYPHTIRVDQKGIVWFTIAGSETVGRLDPDTGVTTVIPLPYGVSGGVSGGTQPYGIAISPITDRMWYGRLFGDKIGWVDPETLEVHEYESPVRGPRRMHFDNAGILWLTGYSEGMLAKITPTDDGFDAKVYPMPEFAEGFRPAPYALGIHPQTQDIWMNENMTDRFYRFIPAEERYIVYPIPLTGTYTRDFSFTADGKACASNNPAPLASLEGGVSEVICIRVD